MTQMRVEVVVNVELDPKNFSSTNEMILYASALARRSEQISTSHVHVLNNGVVFDVVEEQVTVRDLKYPKQNPMINHRFIRLPNENRRISQGGEFSADAWYDSDEKETRFFMIGVDPNFF